MLPFFKLINIYFEVYQNVFDKNEKRQLAQIITNLMAQRVRLDLHSTYFTESYRLEVNCLYKQTCILKIVLNKMVNIKSEFEKLSAYFWLESV